ncbi:MAG: hypothetical protein HKP30_02665, partial [Myxococcales bacterium]|nr:hypothetical protein [Myxococcales bacterium]
MSAAERIKAGIQATADVLLLPVMALAALAARLRTPAIDVGLGPEPLINHVHHAEALRRRGYRVETFVDHVYYITDRFDRILRLPGPLHYLGHHLLLVWCVHRYRAVYLSFHGSALGYTRLAWRFEPWLLRLAGVKTVLLPYGSD